jgi:hypothetical protein
LINMIPGGDSTLGSALLALEALIENQKITW